MFTLRKRRPFEAPFALAQGKQRKQDCRTPKTAADNRLGV
jgi:hypothetical protein